jgi:hypothetical protein
MKKRRPSRIKNLLEKCKILDTDYDDFGGKIHRGTDPDANYSDCSCGCKHFIPLYNEVYDDADTDFGVCTNPKSRRCGLLTFEHQAGFGCFEIEKGLYFTNED